MRFLTAALAALSVLCAASPRIIAQPEIAPVDGRVTIPIAITPNAAVKPASRVYLLPEFRESLPGNRVQGFLRCFMERNAFFSNAEYERRDKWNQLPLKDLPIQEIKAHLAGKFTRDMSDAANMTSIDWQVGFLMRRDGYELLLPDLQKFRTLAHALKTSIRAQVADGDFAGAIRDLRTMFGLVQTLEAHPTLIGFLVALVPAKMAIECIEELIQQPGCPNLFWALSDVPSPLVSLRPAAEGERLMLSADFDDLKAAADPVSDAAILRKMAACEASIQRNGRKSHFLRRPTEPIKPEEQPLAIWQARAKSAVEVREARGRLILAGMKPGHVKVWSPLHVVLLDDVILFEIHRDEFMKCLNLPFWQAKIEIDHALSAFVVANDRTPLLDLVTVPDKIKQYQARTDQRVAALQIIEAIRLYSNNYTGQFRGTLPATLAEMKLPLPNDPVTGQPFEFAVKDGVATLHGVNATPDIAGNNRYYEIRLRK